MRQHPEVAPNLGSAYRVKWVDGAGGARGLVSGVTDGGAMASLSAATAIGEGADLVIAGALIEEREPNRPMTWLVRADAGIDPPADLAGQTADRHGPLPPPFLQGSTLAHACPCCPCDGSAPPALVAAADPDERLLAEFRRCQLNPAGRAELRE